jgi:hypothetical protein
MATPSSTTHPLTSSTNTTRTPAATVVIVSAVDDNGVTTIAGVASTPDRAAAWLRGPTGRRFIAECGTSDALRDPPERCMDLVRVDDLDRHLQLDDRPGSLAGIPRAQGGDRW